MLVERPVELYAELIKHLTIPGEVVADFFAGSGSCPAAAHSLGRDFFAVEKNPERRAAAIQKTKAYAPSK
jgi:DNA modification methylase